jgi:hypothetical protein
LLVILFAFSASWHYLSSTSHPLPPPVTPFHLVCYLSVTTFHPVRFFSLLAVSFAFHLVLCPSLRPFILSYFNHSCHSFNIFCLSSPLSLLPSCSPFLLAHLLY